MGYRSKQKAMKAELRKIYFHTQGYNDFMKGRQIRWAKHVHLVSYMQGWKRARSEMGYEQPKSKPLKWWQRLIKKVVTWANR